MQELGTWDYWHLGHDPQFRSSCRDHHHFYFSPQTTLTMLLSVFQIERRLGFELFRLDERR